MNDGWRKEEEKHGKLFQRYATDMIRILDKYIQTKCPNYEKLFNNSNIYSEVYAWATKGFEKYLYKYFYNSHPLSYNNNLGLGIGANSYITKDRILYSNRNDGYILEDEELTDNFFLNAILFVSLCDFLFVC